MRRDEGMVRISSSRVVRADCRRIRSPEHASCVDQVPGFPAERFTVGNNPTAGPARDTNRDTK
jgi:hypothetical protein